MKIDELYDLVRNSSFFFPLFRDMFTQVHVNVELLMVFVKVPTNDNNAVLNLPSSIMILIG